MSTVRIPGKADSDGAQFFVCVAPQPALDGKYSAFGRVTEGMDVVEKISQIPPMQDGVARKAGPDPQGDHREEESRAVRERHSG